MKQVIMTLGQEPNGAEIFDKLKRGCTTVKPVKQTCGCGCQTQHKPDKQTCGCHASTIDTNTMEVSGNIIDKTTKAPLTGAHIVNVEGHKGTISDDVGAYTIAAQGDQMIQFSFVGFKEITLPASQITTTIEMEEDSNTLDEVIITATKSMDKAGFWVGLGLVGLFTYAKAKKPKRSTPKPSKNG